MADTTEEVDKIYVGYFDTVLTDMTKEQSLMKLQHKELDRIFQSYGFTNEQVADVLSKTLVAETQYINQYATQAAIELMKLDKQNELIDAQILKIEAEVDLLKAKLLQAPIELELLNQQVEKAKLEVDLLEAKLDQTPLELKALEQQVEKLKSEVDMIDAHKDLYDSQADQAEAQAELIAKQGKLIDRQVTGYGDNLISKAGEYQGGLASFAVNANSDDAQSAINEFLATITQMKGRA